MNKVDYNAQKLAIIATYGQPEYDMSDPVNESAKRLKALRSQQSVESRQTKANGPINSEKTEKEVLGDILKESSKSKAKGLANVKLPDLQIDEMYLKAFDEVEKDILHDHFNTNLSDKELGIKYNRSRQAVTGLLNDTRTKVLEARLFDSLAPWRTRLALMRLVESNDSKVTLRLAEHFKVIESESKDINLTTKPIQDDKALKMLKELGDRLASDE